MKNIVINFTIVLIYSLSLTAQQSYNLLSPDETIEIKISNLDEVKFSVTKSGKELISPSPVSMIINDKTALGINTKVKKTKTNSVNRNVDRVIWQKSKDVKENYNELKITFEGNYALTFRAFNEGVAYRFETTGFSC